MTIYLVIKLWCVYIIIPVLLFFFSVIIFSRYEVESDENRLATAANISRRFLGIIVDDGIENGDQEKTGLNNCTQKQSTPLKMFNDNSSFDCNNKYGEELVIDILNDDLISPVKLKIKCKYCNHVNSVIFH